MAKGRRYARDARGRFASLGATARGGRLAKASGKRATVIAKATGGGKGTITKPRGLQPGTLKPKAQPQPRAKQTTKLPKASNRIAKPQGLKPGAVTERQMGRITSAIKKDEARMGRAKAATSRNRGELSMATIRMGNPYPKAKREANKERKRRQSLVDKAQAKVDKGYAAQAVINSRIRAQYDAMTPIGRVRAAGASLPRVDRSSSVSQRSLFGGVDRSYPRRRR